MADEIPGFAQSNPKLGREILAAAGGATVALAGQVIGTIVYSAVVMGPEILRAAAQGMSPSDLQVELMKDAGAMASSWVLVALTLLSYLLAGYVAAKIAKQNEVYIALGTCLVILAITNGCPRLVFTIPMPVVTLAALAQMFLALAAAVFGGYLARVQRLGKDRNTGLSL